MYSQLGQKSHTDVIMFIEATTYYSGILLGVVIIVDRVLSIQRGCVCWKDLWRPHHGQVNCRDLNLGCSTKLFMLDRGNLHGRANLASISLPIGALGRWCGIIYGRLSHSSSGSSKSRTQRCMRRR
jgi:hypothetical protein